jgi:DNA-binding transcriptional ArsR family regulator
MVECRVDVDAVFSSLADATRRDIVRRVSKKELSIGELARPYTMSFAGVAKHVEILKDAGLVTKRKEGKHTVISLKPDTLRVASSELTKYAEVWEGRFDALDALLKRNK